MATKGRDRFKISNTYTAEYARLLAAQEPELADVFEMRELRRDREDDLEDLEREYERDRAEQERWAAEADAVRRAQEHDDDPERIESSYGLDYEGWDSRDAWGR